LSALSDDESLTRINDGKRPGAEVHASADKRASLWFRLSNAQLTRIGPPIDIPEANRIATFRHAIGVF
jgi:hypothetical protein